MFRKIFSPFIYLISEKKRLMLFTIFMAPVFAVLIFPYDDLSDMITSLITKNSNGQVYVQFDDLGMGFLPPSLKMSNVSVDTLMAPTIKAKKIYLAPSIAGLLKFSPGFSANIEDFLKGSVDIDLQGGKKVSDAVKLQNVSIKLKSLSLKSLLNYGQVQVDAEGSLAAAFVAAVDPALIEQPDGEVSIDIDKFKLPASTLPTMLGPVSLPNTEISHISAKGTLKSGNLEITEATIGQAGDTFNGRVKGKIAMRLVRMGSQIVPELGAYEVKIDLNFDRVSEKGYSLFLSLFDKYRTVTGSGSRYAFRLSAQNMNMPPNPSALGSW